MSEPTRGMRNNNPGNIRWGDAWRGLVPEAERTDPKFCQFTDPAWGLRALAKILLAYQDRHDLRTVSAIIGRWAPGNENDTQAYVADVAERCGVSAWQKLDLHAYADMEPLVKAIILHENGSMPYRQTLIDYGLELAGVARVSRTDPSTSMQAPPAPPPGGLRHERT